VSETKSCLGCPSYLDKEGARELIGRPLNAPMCGRYGYVMGKPNSSTFELKKIAKDRAKSCDAHGLPKPAIPSDWRSHVVLGDPDAREKRSKLTVQPEQRDLPRTCRQCEFYIPDYTVQSELGWPSSMCAAKGKLILSREREEAKDCSFSLAGYPRTTTDNLFPLPEFSDEFSASVDPVKLWLKHNEKFIEPNEYETDQVVTPEQHEMGLRAWREIKDPQEFGDSVYIPVFRREYFSPVEQEKIPKTGDDEHPELYVDHAGLVYDIAVLWMEMDETPALWGEPGTGKTEAFRHIAWLMQIPFERISITASTELDDLAGKPQFSKEKGTWFQYGRVPKAWQKPCVMCVDEYNLGQSDVAQFLRPMIDNSKQLVLDMNEGEPLDRHDCCYIGTTNNPAWDVRNVGANVLGDADVSRLMHLSVELPPEELERKIIRDRVEVDGWTIDDDTLDTIMKIAKAIRDQCREGTLPISWGLRSQIQVARSSKWFDLLKSYRRAIADYMEPEARQVLLDQVKQYI
jgi:MoxR-like ATPase